MNGASVAACQLEKNILHVVAAALDVFNSLFGTVPTPTVVIAQETELLLGSWHQTEILDLWGFNDVWYVIFCQLIFLQDIQTLNENTNLV